MITSARELYLKVKLSSFDSIKSNSLIKDNIIIKNGNKLTSKIFRYTILLENYIRVI